MAAGRGQIGPRMDDRQALDAIFYVLRTGCQWKALPRSLGAGSTVHDRFQEWQQAGVRSDPAWTTAKPWMLSSTCCAPAASGRLCHAVWGRGAPYMIASKNGSRPGSDRTPHGRPPSPGCYLLRVAHRLPVEGFATQSGGGEHRT